MRCQKCRSREAVTFNMEVDRGRVRMLFVCQPCSLPVKEEAFSRLTDATRRVLLEASRELTDPSAANRVRPALLYFLLQDESAPHIEAVRKGGIDVGRAREELAAFLAGERNEPGEWVSTRGITPALVGALNVVRRLGTDRVGPEHLLLGLIESPEPGDPWVMIRLAGLAGQIEKSLIAEAALASLP